MNPTALCFVAGTLVVGVCLAQGPPLARPLVPSSDKVVDMPAFGYYDFPKTDSDGNMYVKPAEGYAPASVIKISFSSSQPVVYALPNELKDKFNVLDFSVSPAGDVDILTDTSDHMRTIAFEFNDKAEVKSSISFDLPKGVNIYQFLTTDQNTLLLSGLYGTLSDKTLVGRPYVALFDRSGSLLKMLSKTLSEVDLAKMGSAPLERGAAVGPDGSFYLLDGRHLTVVSPGGEITDKISFQKPLPDLRVAGMYISEGLAAIRLAKLERDHQVSFSFLVIDLTTKQTLGWHAGDKSMGDVISFSRGDGFTFYRADQGVVHIIQAQLR